MALLMSVANLLYFLPSLCLVGIILKGVFILTFLFKFIWLCLGNGTPLQYSCLENPMDGGAWWAAVHGVAKSRTRLSDFSFTFHFPALEKEMATHSSVLAWRIPGMGAWWVALYGVAQSQTQLKQLSSNSSSSSLSFNTWGLR